MPHAEELGPHAGELGKDGMDKVFGIRAPPRERARVPEQRGFVPVVDLPQRPGPAVGEVPEQFPVTTVVTCARHS